MTGKASAAVDQMPPAPIVNLTLTVTFDLPWMAIVVEAWLSLCDGSCREGQMCFSGPLSMLRCCLPEQAPEHEVCVSEVWGVECVRAGGACRVQGGYGVSEGLWLGAEPAMSCWRTCFRPRAAGAPASGHAPHVTCVTRHTIICFCLHPALLPWHLPDECRLPAVVAASFVPWALHPIVNHGGPSPGPGCV